MKHLPATRINRHPASRGVADNLPLVSSVDSTQISLVLAARNPQELACFYGNLLGCSPRVGLSQNHWLVSLGGTLNLEIYRPSRKRSFPVQGRTLSLCLRQKSIEDPLSSLQMLLDESLRLGASLLELPRSEFFGAEAWITDPEGNAVLLMVPAISRSDSP